MCRNLFPFAESHECTQTDHTHARSHSLVSAKTRARSKKPPYWYGKHHNDEISRGV
jgi:hypothetical protein